jgi:ribosome maturation factor RimP
MHVKDALEDVVVAELDGVGYDLVELRRGGTKSRPLIEVRIDRRDGVAISVDDCATASRALEARLDGSELVSPQYVLQVSSPGERALKSSADWRRFVGQWANVLAPEHGGRIEGKILAVETEERVGTGAEFVSLELNQKGRKTECRIPLADIKEARLAFHV